MPALEVALLGEDEQSSYYGVHTRGARSAGSMRLRLAAAFLCGVALTVATVSLSRREADPYEAVLPASPVIGLYQSPFSEASSPAAARESFAAAQAIAAAGSRPSVLSMWTNDHDGAQAAKLVDQMPYKYAIDTVTPVSLQLGRGTCWIFAAIAVLEASYRRQGIERGWLQPHEYVKMSEQAFGVAVLDLCRRVNSSCGALVGTEIWTGTQLKPMDTQGGESYLLYYLLELRYIGALPVKVCPYTPWPGQDHVCPGIGQARASNPLRFEVSHMYTEYEREAAKIALLRGRVLALSTSLVAVTYVLPCTKSSASVLACDPSAADQCIPCPNVRAYAGYACCVAARRDGSTMDGDFFKLPEPTFPEAETEGGHAMTLVGYSDAYRTEFGYVGGFILKNSWWDGLPPSADWKQARGSHSMAYYMQEISAEEENWACPNSASPRRWYNCPGLTECRGPASVVKAAKFNSPLHLECIDRSPYLHGLCTKGDRYFLKSIEPFGSGSGLFKACLIRDPDPEVAAKLAAGAINAADLSSLQDDFASPADPHRRLMYGPDTISLIKEGAPDVGAKPASTDDHNEVCTPFIPLDDVALVWSPIASEMRHNNPDICGFYFFPYSIIDEILARDHNFQVNDMDVVWHPEAYLANAKTFPFLNYSLLQRATEFQQSVHSSGPLPFTRHSPPEEPFDQ